MYLFLASHFSHFSFLYTTFLALSVLLKSIHIFKNVTSMQKQCAYMTTEQSGKRQIDHNSIEVTLTFSDSQQIQLSVIFQHLFQQKLHLTIF
jgi:hypothetical protein